MTPLALATSMSIGVYACASPSTFFARFLPPAEFLYHGYGESCNGKLRDECLNGEIFYSLQEAQIVIEKWRVKYNTRRPHPALDDRPPVPAAYRLLVPPNSVSQPWAVM